MGTVLCTGKYMRYSGVLNRVEKKIHHGIGRIEKKREDSMLGEMMTPVKCIQPVNETNM
jgi:hypothetical protein